MQIMVANIFVLSVQILVNTWKNWKLWTYWMKFSSINLEDSTVEYNFLRGF